MAIYRAFHLTNQCQQIRTLAHPNSFYHFTLTSFLSYMNAFSHLRLTHFFSAHRVKFEFLTFFLFIAFFGV